jgi:hypothetical protein
MVEQKQQKKQKRQQQVFNQHILAKNRIDAFAFSATKLGMLLKPKAMDAESAAAMWLEANCPVHAQHIIL